MRAGRVLECVAPVRVPCVALQPPLFHFLAHGGRGPKLLYGFHALAFYVIRHLGLYAEREARPELQPVILKNRKALEPYLPEAKSA